MRILHLTDYHFKNTEKAIPDQNNIVNCLIKSLKSEGPIDYLLFTGDMVHSGSKYEDFLLVKESLLKRISNEVKIIPKNVFICGGNHDVQRGQELEDITDSLQKVNSPDKLEEYLKKQDGRSFEESMANLKNYQKFQNEFYDELGKDDNDSIGKLNTVHLREIDGKKIGIVTLNSAWRSQKSNIDRGNLMYPTSIVKEATDPLKKTTDFRILLMHHPISDLKDWNAHEMEDIIYNEYHMLFSGHIHRKHQALHVCSDEGIFCCSSPATLCAGDGTIGYSIIDVDLDTFELIIYNRFFVKADNQFYKAPEPISISIPVNAEKREQNEFRKILRKKLLSEIDRANELFIAHGDKESKTFLELFTEPILKNKTQAQIAGKHTDIPNTPISEIIASKENIVIYGKDKSGKTSILYKILLEQLGNFTANKTVPLLVNCKDYKSEDSFDIIKLISKYYEVNYNKAKEITGKFNICLLLDNYDPTSDRLNNFINGFLKEFSHTKFVAATEDTLISQFDSFDFNGKNYNNLFIHEISRPEIRTLASKWPNLTPERQELILDKIFAIFNQLNIPSNFWTVSLFIWIFEKNSDSNFHSSFELIQLYIDNLLDRKRLALDKTSKIDFEDFKNYLANLAHHLVSKHHNTSYSIPYSDLVSFTEQYRQNHKRFVIPVEEVVALIIDKNVLRKTYDERYTYRLNGVFEYFIAYYMKDDESFINSIIEDDHFYLSFGNELELCSGFSKKDKNLLTKVFQKTVTLYQSLSDSYAQNSIDKYLVDKISEIFSVNISLEQLSSKIQKGLTEEKKDEYFKEMQKADIRSEVIQKPFYNQIDQSSQNLEKALFILARVFRNSSVNDEAFNNKILDFILNSSCHLGFLMIDEADVEDENMKTDLDQDDEKLFSKIVTNFMPLIVQTFLYDALAQNNLERVLTDKIAELKLNAKENQFKLILLYFMLIDLDLKSHKGLFDEVIELIDIGILKQTTILKLYYYLLFKSNNNKQLEDLLKQKIQKQTLKIDAKTDKGLLQQGIARASKMILLNRGQRGGRVGRNKK